MDAVDLLVGIQLPAIARTWVTGEGFDLPDNRTLAFATEGDDTAESGQRALAAALALAQAQWRL